MLEILSVSSITDILYTNIFLTIAYIVSVLLFNKNIKVGITVLFTFNRDRIIQYHKSFGAAFCIISTFITGVFLVLTITVIAGWIGFIVISL